ncbi:adenosylhomocysteinase [Microbacterium sp. C7(2022)]|uniref:adenosylhomocysteinase n=1 Tax=Microbacterium sp. C7(2022) TaxID=2992759 RepID=UPI00237B26E5|nr:adenosylhomocysteinase [Microbacterium sp. C7(2022)]MDE0546321.1 adenosylhomocysteinase [Microbacterium sp. C7(2022)]
MDQVSAAEQMIRRFARQTNLLVAGRPALVRCVPGASDGVARALERMLRDLGAPRGHAGDPGLVEYVLAADAADSEILLEGAALPDRADGAARIAFAGRHMPVSTEIASTLDVAGVRIGIAMVLEPKTAQLALLLRDAGAEVAVYAHPDETDVAVADALRAEGVPVVADPTLSGAAEKQAATDFLARGFDVFVDDGSHLIRLAHEVAPDLVDRWWGAAEETTSGLTPLRSMAARGLLRTGVMAVNDAQTKTRFDNRYGTGQSCVFAIADLLDPLQITVRDQPALVIGYGPVGEGVAAHLAALGADVAVAEHDPVRALVARHDGYRVGDAAALAEGALVVSATGVRHTVTPDLLAAARIVAVAGGVPDEVDLSAGAHGALVLADGGCINITAAEGNPIEIMDLSFAVQLSAIAHIVAERPAVGVHALPASVDERVAKAALRRRDAEVVASHTDDTDDWRSTRYTREDAS